MAILGCQGETAPRGPRPVAFALAPRFQQITASFVPFDRVRLTLSRGTSVALDTTISFPASADSIELPLSVVITGATETLTLNLAMIDAAGDTVFRGGPVPVTLSVANGAPAPVPVAVRYTGVGANAKSVRIGTKTVSVFFRDSVTLTATALDSSGQPIPGTPIGWTSLDTSLAKVPADTVGKVVAGLVRGVAHVRAELPTGQADTAQVTVEPVPVAIGIVSGNGQSGPVGAALAQQLDVRVKAADSLGVSGVVVNFAVATGGGSVSTTSDTTSSTGDASTTWTLGGVVGAQSVTATVAGAPTLTVTLGATAAVGAPKKLAFQVQPSNVSANVAMAPAVQVVAQDSFGNATTAFTGNVTLAIGTNPGSATLGGTLTAAAVSGVASFGTLTLNLPGTGYTLVASSAGLTSATSGTFNVTGGVPTQLAFVQQPSNAASGAGISPAVTVQVLDANGILVPTATDAVTVAIGTNPGGGSLSGTKTVTAAAGLATFSGLSIDKAGAGYTLAATATGLSGATSGAFNITPGAATQLALATQPSAAAQSGIAFAQQPVVQIQDAAGNAVSQSGIVVTAAIATGGGTLGGTLTATTNAAGTATFTNLAITGAVGARTLTFTASGLTAVTSGTVTLGAGAATQLALTTQPSAAAQSGVALSPQPVIQIQDASGNAVSQSGVVVTAAIATGGGTLGGTLTATTNAAGAATFTNLAITGVSGARTLSFSATGLTSVTSGTVVVGAGAPAQLAIATQPSASAQSGVAFAQQPAVQLEDGSGNPVSQSGVVVTAAIATGGGTLGGVLTATTNAGGTATFTNLMITGTVGARTLTFTASGLTAATSGTVTLAAGAATQLVITTQPSTTAASGAAFAQQPVLQLEDASGNAVGQSGVVVTAAIATGGGTLGGTATATTNAGGAATFTNLAITGLVGARTLTFTATGLTAATSGTITITAGAASKLAFTTEPPASANAQAGFGFAVTAQDGGGNTVTTFTSPVTVAIATNPAAGTLSGTLTQNGVAGVATFSGVSIDNIGTGYTLSASATGLTSATSSAINILAALNVNAWINGAGGTWSTAANWSKGTVPVATDTVQIKQSGTYTVTVDVAAAFARIDAGAPTGTQTVAVPSATLTAGNGAFAANTVLDLNGGTITGAGTLTTAGAFNWTGGSLGAAVAGGGIRVLSGGTLSISPAASVNLQNYTLEVDGTGTWTGTAFINSGSGAILRVGTGGVLTVSGDPTYSNNLGGAAPDLDNLGTINRTTSTNSFVVNVPVSGTGAWNVQSGSINLQVGGTVSGPVTVSSGAALNLFTGAGALTFDGTSAITGAGTVNFGGGTVTLGGTYGVTGPTQVTAGTANFNTAAGTATSLTVSGGSLSGTGLLSVSGPMSVTSGGIGGPAGAGGTTRVLSSGTLSLAPTAAVNFQGYTLELDGTGTWTGAQTVSAGSAALLRIVGGATLDIQGTPTINNGLGGALSAIDVLGTLTRSTNPGPAVIGVALNDSGAVSVTAGTLRSANGGKSTGTFSVAAGDTLDFNGGADTLSAASRVTGAGTVSFTGGNVVTVGGYNVTGTTLVAGGSLALDAANDTTGTAAVSSGTLSGTGILAITAAMNWTGGNLGAASGAGGTARVLPAATLSLAPTGTLGLQGYTLELAGTGTWSTTQTLQTGSGAVVRVDAGANLTISADATINTALGGAAPLLDNQGTITRTTSTNPVTIAVPFNQAGTLSIQTGTINVADGGTMSGPVTEATNGVLLFSSGSTTLANNFTVSGPAGFVVVQGGTVGGLVAGDTAFIDNLQLTGGSLSLSGGVIKTPYEMLWTGPTAVSGGTLFAPATAGLLMSFATGGPTLQNATVLLAGSGTWSGTAPLSSGSGAVIRILPGANLALTGAGNYQYNLGGTASLLDNQGTLISAVSGSPGAFTVSAQVSNSGSGGIQVNGDTLRLTGGFSGTFPGVIGVTNGSTLELGGSSTYTLASPLNLGGNLLVSGGTLALNGKPTSVSGTFATTGGGVLQMTSATDSLFVGGNASFGGGSTSGLLTAGTLVVDGDFAQTAGAAAFAPSGAHHTVLDGTGTQNVSFANPTTSFFQRLLLPAVTHNVVLQTNVQVTDSMTMQGGGGAATLTGAGTSQRLTVGGLLRLIQSTASPKLTPPVLELSVTPVVGSTPGTMSPDTTVYLGSIATLPTGGGIAYKSVRVNTTDTLASPGGVTYNGDLIVSGGAYRMGAGTDSVGGFLRTEGTGALLMVAIVAAPTLAVRDSAVFAGGPSTTLTGGAMRLYGNFVERGTTGQFAPTGTRVSFQKSTAGAQTIQMADSVNSFFHDLVLNRPIVDTVRLLSNVLVQDSAIISGSSVLTSTNFEALKTPATGAVRVHSGGVLRPFRAEIGLWGEASADSGTIGSGRISPDTTVFVGTNDTINSVNANQFCGACAWRNVRASGDTLVSLGGFLGLSTVYNGNLLITNGLYMMAALQGTDSVYGFVRTEGSGQLRLQSTDGTETLVVRDSAVFAGGTEAGLLGSGGVLAVGGSFVQRGGPTSFVGIGSFTNVFDGTGTQTVTFASPGASQSTFANVFVGNASGGTSQPTGITLGSDIYLNGSLQDTSTAATDSIFGNGHTVNANGISLGSQFVMNDAQLVTNTTNIFFSGLTFRNMSTTVTQWTLNVPTGTGITVSGLDFQTPPTTGHYFDALMSITGGNSMTVTGASPAASAMTGLYTRFNASGPVVVVWNGTQLP